MDIRSPKKMSKRKRDKNRGVQEDKLIGLLDVMLTQGMVGQALELVRLRDTWQNAKETAWAIIDLVLRHMESGFKIKVAHQFEMSAYILCDIASKVDPEEAMPKFTDTIENTLNDLRFIYTLMPIQVCLQKIFKNRVKHLEKMIKLIHHNLKEYHPVPSDGDEDVEYEGAKATSYSTVNIFNASVTHVYDNVIQFYGPFMEESALGNKSTTLPKNQAALQKQNMIVFILQLLGKPLMYLDLQDGGVRSEARKIAEDLIFDLSKMVGDYFMFFANAEQKESECFYTEMVEDEFYTAEDEIYIPTAALANLYYLLIAEEIGIDRTPCVYDPVYIWMNSMYLATVLIMLEEDYQHTVVRKGLLLFKKATSKFKDLSIPHQVLEARANKRFIRALADFDAKASDKDIKALVTECLHLYIFKLDNKGRYLLLANIVLDIKEPNFVAKLTIILHEILVEALNTSPMTPFFSGDYLYSLLSYYFQISRVAGNDIIDAHSQVVACLKLLQYLYANDTKNATGIQEHTKHFKSKFLGPLEKAVVKFRADYESLLKDMEYCLALAPHRKMGDLPDSMVDWVNSGEMKRETDDMIAEVQASLNGFHVVDCWLAQIVAGPAIESKLYIARKYNIGAKTFNV